MHQIKQINKNELNYYNYEHQISLDEFVGQNHNKEIIKILIQAAKKIHKPLEHIFLAGQSGYGKTTLAQIIAKSLNVKCHIINGLILKKPADIISVFTNIQPYDCIFIDEVHGLSLNVEETLYPILSSNEINIMLGKDYNAKIINIKLPPFTLICATTKLDKLSKPLLNRFRLLLTMKEYSQQDIEIILKKEFEYFKIPINIYVIKYLTSISRLNPRQAKNLVKIYYNFCLAKNFYKAVIFNLTIIKKFFINAGYYKYGLKFLELEYLKLFFKNELINKPLSLTTISQLLGESVLTITNYIEPFLLQKKFIIKTSKGRIVTNKFKKIYKNIFI